MSKKFKVLKQITAIILCISLLSSQMTITYADETENSDMENGVDAYEQSYEAKTAILLKQQALLRLIQR